MAYPEHRSISETALPDVGAHPASLLAPRAPWVLIQFGDAGSAQMAPAAQQAGHCHHACSVLPAGLHFPKAGGGTAGP